MEAENKFEKYPKTDLFYVKDSIGVPHPFCITDKHLANTDGIYLDDDSIKRYEQKIQRASCGVKGCQLMYEEHGQALVIACKLEEEGFQDAEEDLREYLVSIQEMAKADGYVGFTFMLEDKDA